MLIFTSLQFKSDTVTIKKSLQEWNYFHFIILIFAGVTIAHECTYLCIFLLTYNNIYKYNN